MLKKVLSKWKRQLKLFSLRGSKVYCNVCDRSFRKFLPTGHDFPVLTELKVIGGGRRENCLCPNCFSADRDRLLGAYLARATSLFRTGGKVLHIAPDRGLKRVLQSVDAIDYTSGDKFVYGYQYDDDVIQMDVTHLRFEDARFDFIICCHVLEHVPDDRKAMEELYRVLKPGGLAVLQVPFSYELDETIEDPSITAPEEMEKRFGQRDHVRIYGKDYFSRLESVGFSTKKYSLFREDQQLAERLRLNPKEDLFIVKKIT